SFLSLVRASSAGTTITTRRSIVELALPSVELALPGSGAAAGVRRGGASGTAATAARGSLFEEGEGTGCEAAGPTFTVRRVIARITTAPTQRKVFIVPPATGVLVRPAVAP